MLQFLLEIIIWMYRAASHKTNHSSYVMLQGLSTGKLWHIWHYGGCDGSLPLLLRRLLRRQSQALHSRAWQEAERQWMQAGIKRFTLDLRKDFLIMRLVEQILARELV